MWPEERAAIVRVSVGWGGEPGSRNLSMHKTKNLSRLRCSCKAGNLESRFIRGSDMCQVGKWRGAGAWEI